MSETAKKALTDTISENAFNDEAYTLSIKGKINDKKKRETLSFLSYQHNDT